MSKNDFNFGHSFRVRYSEIDGQKVVFNAHYLTYFDTAITEYFRWLSFDYIQYSEESGFDFHTVRTLVEYKSPIHFDEEIYVYVRTGKIGRSSLVFVIEIYGDNKDKDDLRATGEVIWVHTDQKKGKSSPLHPDLVARIRERQGAIAL